MKSETKSTQANCAQVHDWAAENRLLRKELRAREKRVEELEAMVSSLNNQLSEKIDQINDMMQKAHGFYDRRRWCKPFGISSPVNSR